MRHHRVVESMLGVILLSFVILVLYGMVTDPEAALQRIDPAQAAAISQRKIAEEMKRANDLKERELRLKESGR